MMTNDKKARFLALYRQNALEIARLDREIAALQERYNALREVPEVYKDLRKMPDSYMNLRGAAEAFEELRAILLERLRLATQERAEAERCISRVEDARHRTLLTLHYLDGLTWEKTADAMHMDIRWLFRMREKALASLTIPET